MIDSHHCLSIRQQTELLAVTRSQVYYKSKPRADQTLLANQIRDIYLQYPMYGYRRVHASLKDLGIHVNLKCVLRLMRLMNLSAIYPKPKTTIRDKQHQVYPYLLKGLEIVHPHQAWQVDITYLWTPQGFMYLCALIDIFSRYILSWRLSNTLQTHFCLETLEDAICKYGPPDIMNSDQGCQFTSHSWIQSAASHNIKVSMCGAGRSNDNAYIERFWRTLKYEGVHLENWKTPKELREGIRGFIHWYNTRRPHQALKYQTPQFVLTSYPGGFMDKLDLVNQLKLPHNSTGSTTTLII